MAVLVEGTHVQERQIGIAAATGTENPGADGERFDVVEGEFPFAHGEVLTRTRS